MPNGLEQRICHGQEEPDSDDLNSENSRENRNAPEAGVKNFRADKIAPGKFGCVGEKIALRHPRSLDAPGRPPDGRSTLRDSFSRIDLCR
jgi:hypothetical protein